MSHTPEDRLIVFIKAPSPGEVKTRLLSVLSAEEAAHLYRCLVMDTLEALTPIRDVKLVIAYAADPHFPDLAWLVRDHAMVLQHGRTLGERLLHAFQQAFEQQARHVVALGSDAPDLSTQWIRQAFQALARYDVVVGPTMDGGYHLLGLTRPCPELFVDMPWSSPRLFGQTLDRINHLHLSVQCLEPIADFDTSEDLHRYVSQEGFRQSHTHAAHFLRKHLRAHSAFEL